MNCRECGVEFLAKRDWQEFCCTEHRQVWHYRQRKRAEVEAAEVRRAERINGHGASEEKIDLAQLGLTPKPQPIKRRRVA